MHALARRSLNRTEGNHNLPSCVRDAAFFLFIFFLCNEAIQRLASTRTVFVIVVIIEAFFLVPEVDGSMIHFAPFSPKTRQKPGFPLLPIKRR